jgi:anti-sigma factor RsiW
MTCRELHDLLADYLSGDLVVEQHRTVEVHLGTCKSCVTLVETCRYTIKLARALPKCDRLPPDVEQRLREGLKQRLAGGGDGARKSG